MPSELKFRVWHKGAKRWGELFDLVFGGKSGAMFAVRAGFPKGIDEQALADDVVVEQFTGLLDKNGKEIYEGDIVHASTGNCLVVWQDHTASFAFGMRGWMYNHFIEEMGEVAVIGNRHEHPELMK